MKMDGKNVAIIGAGIVGLSTALAIQQSFPEANLTLFADKFNEKTLSAGAGGIFRPEVNVHHDINRVRNWCNDSFTYFLEIIGSTESAKAGMHLVSGYSLSSSPNQEQNKLLQEFIPECRKLTKKEMKLFPDNFISGMFYTTVVIDCLHYLPWMKSKYEEAGGKILEQYISSLDEISDDFDIIINCTGLGAKRLLKDDMMVPIRGQTIKVKAPWIKNFYYGDQVYIIPGVDYVTLGGVKDYGSWDMNVNPYQKQFIWDKCTELVPSLRKAEILWDWVGLRPFRPSVRVDASFVKCNGKYCLVVNNYGHGGHGVALSWGTAQDVTKILHQLLEKRDLPLAKL